MAQKIPPPPFLTGGDQPPDWQAFNRWLLEVTSVLSNEGGINPDEVTGLPALFTEVAVNTSDIQALEATTGGQSNDIINLQFEDANLQGQIATLNGQVTTLGARAQVFNGTADPAGGFGSVGDWFANTAGAAGHRIFVKTGVATWTAFPF